RPGRDVGRRRHDRRRPRACPARSPPRGRGLPQNEALIAMPTPPKLLGKYATPRFAYGDVVACARRGEVRIVALSDAPIPWPLGQPLPKGRAGALVLCGALAEAVRRESSEAVASWWGVTAQTVTVWRKALGVGQDNVGTKALKSERLAPALERAREAARTP